MYQSRMRSKICRPKVFPPLFPHIWWSLLASTCLFIYLCQCLLWTDKLSSRAADTMRWYQISLFNRSQRGGLLSDHPSGKKCVRTNNLENVFAPGVGSVLIHSFKLDSHIGITVMWSPPTKRWRVTVSTLICLFEWFSAEEPRLFFQEVALLFVILSLTHQLTVLNRFHLFVWHLDMSSQTFHWNDRLSHRDLRLCLNVVSTAGYIAAVWAFTQERKALWYQSLFTTFLHLFKKSDEITLMKQQRQAWLEPPHLGLVWERNYKNIIKC